MVSVPGPLSAIGDSVDFRSPGSRSIPRDMFLTLCLQKLFLKKVLTGARFYGPSVPVG